MLKLQRLRAFTFIEVIATLAVISVLAGAVVPSIVGYLARRDIERTAVILSDVAAAVVKMQASPVTFYPFRISHLGSPIASTDTTSCSGIAPATPVTLYAGKAVIWGNAGGGPFFHRTIPTTGLVTPMGTIIDTLYRSAAKASAGFLPLIIRNVRIDDADELNSIIDGDADAGDGSNTLGKLIWAAPVSGFVDIKYTIAVAANKC